LTAHNKFGVREDFFRRLREASRVKQRILTHYFVAYNRKLARSREKVGYADLFAGPGSYRADDGSIHKSIPLLLCETVVANGLFRDRIHLWFNEADPESFEQLKIGVQSVPGIESLRYKPRLDNKVVTADWAARLRRLSVPTLVFLDPCGYKGLSLGLVASVIEGFGNDCIFFFNYSRINMKLDLEIMNESIDQFFEAVRARAIRDEIKNRSPHERETIILAAVRGAIEQAGAIPLTFRFKTHQGRTSHHLIYASKNADAAGIMKRILRSVSSEIDEGVGSHEHDPRSKTGSLFAGLYQVEERLLTVFSGRNITFGELLEEEAGTKFTDTNYRDALLRLEAEGTVTANPPAHMRPFQAGRQQRSLSRKVRLQFGSGRQHGA
jgi:three-Cys-motif partner protein